jgi:Ca2+-binding EF-hand superfamily protein
VDKIEIIRKAFRHLCRDPTVKMRTLQDIRLQFGTPNADGTMRVSSEVFRQSIPKLMSIVQVDDMTSLNHSDIDYLIEEIDLNHDHSITYSEFINFIAFPKSKLRKIARAIQQKLSKAAKSDADVRQLFNEISAKDHRSISVHKFQDMLVTRLDVRLRKGEVSALVNFLDLDKNGKVNFNEWVRFLRDHGLNGRGTGVFDGTTRHRPVVDIALSFNAKDEKKYKNMKYERSFANLNQGTFGKDLHLWLLREESKTSIKNALFSSATVRKRPELKYPICEIRIDTKDNSSSLYADGFKCIDGSTNKGWFNWGTDMYLWVRRDYKLKECPINDIHLTTGNANDSTSKIYDIPSRGYRRLEANLNHGTKGSDVFLWYHKDNHGETPRGTGFSKNLPISHLVKLKKKVKQNRNKSKQNRRWQTTKKELDALHEAIAKRVRHDIRLKAAEMAHANNTGVGTAPDDRVLRTKLNIDLELTFHTLIGSRKTTLSKYEFKKMLKNIKINIDQSTFDILFKEIDYSRTGKLLLLVLLPLWVLTAICVFLVFLFFHSCCPGCCRFDYVGRFSCFCDFERRRH